MFDVVRDVWVFDVVRDATVRPEPARVVAFVRAVPGTAREMLRLAVRGLTVAGWANGITTVADSVTGDVLSDDRFLSVYSTGSLWWISPPANAGDANIPQSTATNLFMINLFSCIYMILAYNVRIFHIKIGILLIFYWFVCNMHMCF